MTSLAKDLWNKMLRGLETSISAVNFDVWIKTLEPIVVQDNALVLCASNENIKNFVNDKFKDQLFGAAKELNHDILDILIIEPSSKDRYKAADDDIFMPTDDADVSEAKPIETNIINPKYNFENFVVGKSNQFMYAAAKAVAEEPGIRYNPLFIYGGSGLGKTHIMYAIANYIKVLNPKLKIMYASSEKFLNDFVESIGTKKGKSFRERYRDIDVLMVDDIHFIAGKQGTQEEIFHTFNALHGAEKQLVFTSDRPPKEIRDLEQRLQSRFEGGLMVDVQPPDLETRIAILKKKAADAKVRLTNEVLSAMAQQVLYNVRDLEGLLNRVIFLARLKDVSPNVEIVQEASRDTVDKNEDSITAERVIDCVCRYFNVSKDELIGKKKTREIATPRQICMYHLNETVGMPLAAIGSLLGGRDHTTVLHARNKVLELITTNVKVKLAVNDIKEMLLSNRDL